jgi:hypothetical protein
MMPYCVVRKKKEFVIYQVHDGDVCRFYQQHHGKVLINEKEYLQALIALGDFYLFTLKYVPLMR